MVNTEPQAEHFKLWHKDDRAGVDVKINFNGAKVILSFFMREKSPVLWGTLRLADDSLDKIKTATMNFSACVSKFIGGKYLVNFYDRRAITPARTIKMVKSYTKLTPEDKYLILQDEKFDKGKDTTKGSPPIGPCYFTLQHNHVKKLNITNAKLLSNICQYNS